MVNRPKIVVTGLSAVTPIGHDLAASWENLKNGVSGVKNITRFDTTNHVTKFAGQIVDFDASPYFADAKALRRLDYFTIYAVAAAHQLMADCGLEVTEENAHRIGAMVGCGLGGIHTIEDGVTKLNAAGPKRVNPFFIPVLIANMAAGQVGIHTQVKGPTLCTTSACASGLHGIAYAAAELWLGHADAMICGGTESTISPVGVAGFNVMKALSTRNDDPVRASRPFDKDRDGFVMGEGCGLMMIETEEHAKARGAKIYAQLDGYGASGDAYHMAAPPEDGSGLARAMRAALASAQVNPEAIDYINAHGTSTPLNDLCETRAVKSVFGEHAHKMAISSNKSMIGHLLGAAGGVEAVFTVKSIEEGVLPPTINHDEPGEECDLDYVPNEAREAAVSTAMCNNAGFGGANCSAVFSKYEG